MVVVTDHLISFFSTFFSYHSFIEYVSCQTKKKKKTIAWPLALDMTKFNRLHRVTHTHCLSKAKEKRKSHQKPGLFQMVGQQQQQKPESTMMNYLGGLLTKEEREKKLSRLF